MGWIIFLLIIGWPLSGLVIYLRTATTVQHLAGAWLPGRSEDERFRELLTYVGMGPIGYYSFRQQVKQAQEVRQKQKEAADIRLLFGPTETDDYQRCCELKQEILSERLRLEKEAAELKLRPDPNAYIREFMPELADLNSPAEVRHAQISARLAKLEQSLKLTEDRLASLTEAEQQRQREIAELRRRAEAAEAEDQMKAARAARQAELRQQELKRRQEEAAFADKVREEQDARAHERAVQQAILVANQRAADRENERTAAERGLNATLAERLWTHRSRCLNLGSSESPDWIDSVFGLAIALKNNKRLRKRFSDNKRRICEWLSSDVEDYLLATLVADSHELEKDEASRVSGWITERLRYAQQLRDEYQAELTRLKLIRLNGGTADADEPAEEAEAAPAEAPTDPLTGEADGEPGVLFSLKSLEDLARGE